MLAIESENNESSLAVTQSVALKELYPPIVNNQENCSTGRFNTNFCYQAEKKMMKNTHFWFNSCLIKHVYIYLPNKYIELFTLP